MHCDQDLDLRDSLHWFEPVFLRNEPDQLLRDIPLESVDVLGLSCYVWNFAIQCEIAKRIKRANPNALVVAGGPEPDWNDPNFFLQHPYIDIVVMQDGEIPFSQILRQRLRGPDADFTSVPGVILQHSASGILTAKKTFTPEKPKSWTDLSPYCDESMFEKLIEKYGSKMLLSAVFESNRGCPYKCSFCDWGSNVFSKIRSIPDARLRREINWFAEKKVNRVYVADANFGILARDEEITDWVCEAKRKHQWPKVFDICVAKNHLDRVSKICLKLHDADLLRGALIGFQTTNGEALKAMERINMSSSKHIEMLDVLNQRGVTVFGTIIVGCPGDTLGDFQKTIGDLLEMGFHSVFRYFLYSILPNAPAAQKTYSDRYGIHTLRRKMLDFVSHKSMVRSEYYPRTEYVVAHSKMSKSEWILQCQFAAFVTAFHSLGLTRLVAHYFRNTRQVSYTDFYRCLFDSFINGEGVTTDALRFLEEKLKKFLTDPQEHFFIELEFEDGLLEPERWLFLDLIEKRERLIEELRIAIERLAPVDLEIEDVLKFQNFLLFPIDWSQCKSREVFHYDWLTYFRQIESPTSSSLSRSSSNLGNPNRMSASPYEIKNHADFSEYEWLREEKGARWRHFSRKIVRSFNYKDSVTIMDFDSFEQVV